MKARGEIASGEINAVGCRPLLATEVATGKTAPSSCLPRADVVQEGDEGYCTLSSVCAMMAGPEMLTPRGGNPLTVKKLSGSSQPAARWSSTAARIPPKPLDLANRIPLRRDGSVEDVTDAAISLIANEFITDGTLVVDGGISMRIIG